MGNSWWHKAMKNEPEDRKPAETKMFHMKQLSAIIKM